MSVYVWNSQGSCKVTLRITGSEGDPQKGESLTQLWNVTQVWFTSRTSYLNIFKDYDEGLGKGFGSRLDIYTIEYLPTSIPTSLLACLRSHDQS